jgi:hypothetical protein
MIEEYGDHMMKDVTMCGYQIPWVIQLINLIMETLV